MSDCREVGGEIITLAPDLDLAAAQALHDAIRATDLSRQDTVLDGGHVERVSTPAVQVILAVARACAAEGRSLTVRKPSAALTAAFDDLGLGNELQRWCRC